MFVFGNLINLLITGRGGKLNINWGIEIVASTSVTGYPQCGYSTGSTEVLNIKNTHQFNQLWDF